jgi:hypothetical protein
MVRLELQGRDFYGALSGQEEMFLLYEAVNLLIHRAAGRHSEHFNWCSDPSQ